MSDLIERARSFSYASHHLQTRRYTNEPYINHCAAVARMVASSKSDEADEAVAAAWLHDVAEDCGVTWKQLAALFGPNVTRKVWYLTNCPREIGNRAERCKVDRDRLSIAPANVQTIKCADLIDNTSSIVAHDWKFARVYLKEKRALLDVLHAANWHLRSLAYDTLALGEAQIESIKEST